MRPETGLDQNLDALTEHAYETGQRYGAWPPAVRQIWQAEGMYRRRRELSFVHSIGLLLCLLCLPLDYNAGPEVFEHGLFLRLGLVTPVYLLAIAAAWFGSWRQQRWTSVLAVACFATVAGYLGMHFAHDEVREYIMAAGLLVMMASVVVPLRPRHLLAMVLLSLAGLWTVYATAPVTWAGPLHVLLAFVTVSCFLTLAIPVRTTMLKDRNFLLGLRSRFATERLIAVNEQLRELSHRDDLTGLPNRRYFERIFDTAFRSAGTGDGSLALMMIDVDRFKRFNDSYGHMAGDRALKQVGGVLERYFSAPDRAVARYGGEEFIAIVQECGVEDALRLADEVRQAIAARQVTVGRRGRASLTVSIGVAIRSDADASGAELVERADAALYEAKQAGRDLVRLARTDDGSPPPSILKEIA